jgi:hypothetical protein
MNERIRELHIQAQQEAFNEPIDIENCAVADIKGFSQQVYEKFAELIVGECYETIKKDMELAHIQLIPIDFGIYANGRLHRIIKEHFGVEK